MSTLPSFLKRYFWENDFNKIDLKKHKKYIASKILSLGDLKAVSWLNTNFSHSFLKKVSLSKQVDIKSRNLWKLYYSQN